MATASRPPSVCKAAERFITAPGIPKCVPLASRFVLKCKVRPPELSQLKGSFQRNLLTEPESEDGLFCTLRGLCSQAEAEPATARPMILAGGLALRTCESRWSQMTAAIKPLLFVFAPRCSSSALYFLGRPPSRIPFRSPLLRHSRLQYYPCSPQREIGLHFTLVANTSGLGTKTGLPPSPPCALMIWKAPMNPGDLRVESLARPS